MEHLEKTQNQLKELLPAQGSSAVIKALKDLLPQGSPRYDDLLQLETRKNELQRKRLLGIISDEELQLADNQLNTDLIDFINSLVEEDFSAETAQSKYSDSRKAKRGHVLYKIPKHMQLAKEYRCVVRIAISKEIILEDLDLDESVQLESIRISDYMMVELIDLSESLPFSIRTFNEPIQFIDVDDYTEWLFWVKAKQPGIHSLLLKVSVIEIIGGKERKREVVLEEQVKVSTDDVSEAEIPFQPVFAFSAPEGGSLDYEEPSKSFEGFDSFEVEVEVEEAPADKSIPRQRDEVIAPSPGAPRPSVVSPGKKKPPPRISPREDRKPSSASKVMVFWIIALLLLLLLIFLLFIR